MFGIGFTELLLIAVIAILFLGPDKLPETMVQIAKFIKSVKKTIGDAKASLEEEMKISDLKEEALNYKKQLDEATSELRNFKNIDLDDMEDLLTDTKQESSVSPRIAATQKDPYAQAPRSAPEEISSETHTEAKRESVTFKKKEKRKKTSGQNNHTDTAPKSENS